MHHLTDRYFEDQCTAEALEKILRWFQTTEGQNFLSQQIKEDFYRLVKTDGSLPDKAIPTERIFNRIQMSKDNPSRTEWILTWLTAVSLITIDISVIGQTATGICATDAMHFSLSTLPIA